MTYFKSPAEWKVLAIMAIMAVLFMAAPSAQKAHSMNLACMLYLLLGAAFGASFVWVWFFTKPTNRQGS